MTSVELTMNGQRRGFTCEATVVCPVMMMMMMLGRRRRREGANIHRKTARGKGFARQRFASGASPHPGKKAHVKVEVRTHSLTVRKASVIRVSVLTPAISDVKEMQK